MMSTLPVLPPPLLLPPPPPPLCPHLAVPPCSRRGPVGLDRPTDPVLGRQRSEARVVNVYVLTLARSGLMLSLLLHHRLSGSLPSVQGGGGYGSEGDLKTLLTYSG